MYIGSYRRQLVNETDIIFKLLLRSLFVYPAHIFTNKSRNQKVIPNIALLRFQRTLPEVYVAFHEA